MGGPMGAMSVAWNPIDREQMAAIGMGSAALSNDGGGTWKELSLPQGSSAVAYSADGQKLYVASLIGVNAQIFTSADEGKNWNAVSAATSNSSDLSTMDPNTPGMDPDMPGMGHAETATPQRPLVLTLGAFGLGISLVFLAAILLRRKDRARNLTKKATRACSSTRR